jgi:hypothetical protein
VAAALIAGGGAEAGGYRAPHTAWGAPDLNGLWDNGSYTKLQRPRDLKGPLVPDPKAAAAFARKVAQFAGVNAPAEDAIGQAQSEFPDSGDGFAVIRGQVRSSQIVYPADGRLPYSAAGRAPLNAAGRYDNVEERDGMERCITSAGDRPPLLAQMDANVFQFVLTPDHLAIVSEKNHDLRIIPIGRPRDPRTPPSWTGDSIAHWEGDVLVVETANFRPGLVHRGIGVMQSEQARVTERFSRVGAGELLYEFTVTDPGAYAQTWKAEMLFKPAKGPIYEYACHEGNYSLPSILAAARQGNQAPEKPAPAPPPTVAAK